MKRVPPLFFLIIVAVFPGCDIINPAEEIPGYLHIPHFEKNTTYVDEGSASHNITDAWVFVDDQPVGTFELPATIPVFADGETKVTIVPGIKKNGISAIRIRYPYYKGANMNLSFDPATVDTIIPSTEYVDGLSFPLKEDFESGNEFTGIGITTNPSEVFEGKKSGKVTLDGINTNFKAISNIYTLPGGGKQVFLEMDYRNTNEFRIFLQFANGTDFRELLTVTPKEVWNKIYVDLTEVVSSVGASEFQVVFASTLPEEESSAEYLWDNIKIVHN